MTNQTPIAPWKLETQRTRLREFVDADLDFLRAHCRDVDVMRYIGVDGKPFADAEISGALSFFKTHYAKHGFGPWAVSLKEGEAVIGIAGLKFVPHLDQPDLGFSFFKPYWGKGYATEICHALIDYGFKTHHFNKIGAITTAQNTAAIKILKKLGMKFEKTVSHRGLECDLYTISASR